MKVSLGYEKVDEGSFDEEQAVVDAMNALLFALSALAAKRLGEREVKEAGEVLGMYNEIFQAYNGSGNEVSLPHGWRNVGPEFSLAPNEGRE